MAKALTIDFNQPMPLFPLAQTVLLPHATVPLHIFEPRYRAMTRESLEGDRLIAMATLAASEQQTEDPLDRPALREHVCLGVIAQHQQLVDGRYHILLQGVCRARIVREIEHEPYRLGLIEPTEAGETMEIDLGDERQRLAGLLDDPLLRKLSGASTMRDWLRRDLPTAAVVDLIALSLCHDGEERYQMLAEPDPAARVRWLENYLREIRRTLEIAEKTGPSLTEDGLHLN